MRAAIWYRARAELRRRWMSTLVLVVLAGLAGGVVLAAAAGARRTGTAMDRFVEYYAGGTLFVEAPPELLDAVSDLPEVVATGRGAYTLMAPAGPDGERSAEEAGTVNPFLVFPLEGTTNRPLLVEGRLPDPDDPVAIAIDEQLAEARDIGPGDPLRMYGYAPAQIEENGPEGTIAPEGPVMDLEVAGIVRSPNDVVPPRTEQADVVYASDNDLYLTPAWYDRFGEEVAMFGRLEESIELRLRNGQADTDTVRNAVRALPGGEDVIIDTAGESQEALEASRRSIDLAVTGMWAFAAIAAVASVVVVAQALGRTLRLDAEDAGVLRALGFGPLPLATVAVLRSLAIAVPAAAVAAGVAIALSPLFPLGLARNAEIDPGADADVPVLLLGALGIVLVVVAWGALTGTRLVRAGGGAGARPSRFAERLSEAGAPPPVVTGARLALSGARNRGALLGLAVGGLAFVAAATFSASLVRLVDSPALQGWNWDVVVGNGQDTSIEVEGEELASNELVGAWSPAAAPLEGRVGGVEAEVEAVGYGDDGVGPVVVEGRGPQEPGEVALGQGTASAAGAAIGDRVQVEAESLDGQRGAGELTVVGLALFNDREREQTDLGSGAWVTLDGSRALGVEPFVRYFLVDYADGVDEAEAYRSLQADFGRTVLRPVPAVDVENLELIGELPIALAWLVAGLSLAAVAHALVTTLRRRRRDFAVLRTLGFLRRQLGVVVVAFVTTTVVLAVALGTPLGVGLGRWGWRQVAESMGTPAGPVVDVAVVALILPVTLLIALAVAARPARSAATTDPAVVLRGE